MQCTPRRVHVLHHPYRKASIVSAPRHHDRRVCVDVYVKHIISTCKLNISAQCSTVYLLIVIKPLPPPCSNGAAAAVSHYIDDSIRLHGFCIERVGGGGGGSSRYCTYCCVNLETYASCPGSLEVTS